MGHVHVLPPGKEDPEIEPNNWRWLDLIDHLKIKVSNKLPLIIVAKLFSIFDSKSI